MKSKGRVPHQCIAPAEVQVMHGQQTAQSEQTVKVATSCLRTPEQIREIIAAAWGGSQHAIDHLSGCETCSRFYAVECRR